MDFNLTIPLEPSLTFHPIEIESLFFGGPPAHYRHAPQIAAVENHEAHAVDEVPALIPQFQAP